MFAGVRDADYDVPHGTTPVELDVTDESTLERAESPVWLSRFAPESSSEQFWMDREGIEY